MRAARALAVAFVALVGSDARAENWLVGPLIGFTFGGSEVRGVAGVEGGVGVGYLRLNAGYEYRTSVPEGSPDARHLAYLQLDPWAILGLSLGVGVDSNRDTHPVFGFWEGVPLGVECARESYRMLATVAVGYRYNGVHEIYATLKAGAIRSSLTCL